MGARFRVPKLGLQRLTECENLSQWQGLHVLDASTWPCTRLPEEVCASALCMDRRNGKAYLLCHGGLFDVTEELQGTCHHADLFDVIPLCRNSRMLLLQVQNSTDRYIKEVDSLLANKEQEMKSAL